MVFTYTPSDTPTDLTRVRFWTRDTVSATALWTDDEISMMIAEEGDYKGAVIALLEQALVMIGREPDKTVDWLRVAWGSSAKTLEGRLESLKSKWGKGYAIRTGFVTRVDGYSNDIDSGES